MKRKAWGYVAGTVVLILIPLLMPNIYALSILTLIAIYAISASGLNFGYGFAGQISWGQAAFMGVGAYVSALTSVTLHWPMFLAFVASIVGSALVGLVIGWPTSRMQGHYLAIATIGLVIVIGDVLTNWSVVTKGTFGIGSIPPIGLTPKLSITNHLAVVYVIIAVTVLSIVILRNIVHSPFGLMIRAMRDDLVAAQTFGVTRSRYNSLTFAVTAVYGGMAGSLYAHVFGYISPDTYTLDLSITLFTMVLVGGAGTLLGPVIGSVIFTLIPQILSSLGSWIYAIEGLIIVLFIVLRPNGLATLFSNLPNRRSTHSMRKDESHARS